jgi:hypothetical protein
MSTQDLTNLLPSLPGKVLDKHVAKDSTQMDSDRKNTQTYDYLCHIGEAKEYFLLI